MTTASMLLLLCVTLPAVVYGVLHQPQQHHQHQYDPYLQQKSFQRAAAQSYPSRLPNWQFAMVVPQTSQHDMTKNFPRAQGNYWVQAPQSGYYNVNSFRQDQETVPPTPTIVAPSPPGEAGNSPAEPSVPPTPSLPPEPAPQVVNPPFPVAEMTSNELQPAAPSPPSDHPLAKYCKAPRGQFPSGYCNTFVNCWDDVVVEQECPAGLQFGEVGYCDYPFNVQCGDREASKPEPPAYGGQLQPGEGGTGSPGVDLSGPGSRCPTPYGTYRSNKNCGLFYVCVASVPYEFICPAGLNFHEDIKVCDYPYRVECNGIPTNPIPPEPVTEPETETTTNVATESPSPSPSPSPPAPPLSPAPVHEVETPAVEEPAPSPLAPAVATPEGYFALKKVPAGILDTRTSCTPNSVYKLNALCSTVAVCTQGRFEIVTCSNGMGYHAATHRCVPYYEAYC